MYVRWQRRERQQPDVGYYHDTLRDEDGKCVRNKRRSLLHTRRRADGLIGLDARLNAVLVESVRVNGKPQQRHVAWLGSITESRSEVVHQRRYFWDEVMERLDRLSNRISIEDRRRIEAAIARKIPRLSREEHDASIKTCVEGYAGPSDEHKPYRPPT